MISSRPGWLVGAAVAVLLGGWQLNPAPAFADPEVQPAQPQSQTPPDQQLHNITYRARVDGVSRGAAISYLAEGGKTQLANPTMVPGRTFEAQTVLPTTDVANIRLSIEWPYSANLHCEILIDDQVAAQADDFIGPKLTPQKDDPDYGALTCEAPVAGVANPVPPDPNAPPPPPPAEGAPPADAPPPPPPAG
jgi:hypothetical protein